MLKTMFLFGHDDNTDLDVSSDNRYLFENFETMMANIHKVLPISSNTPEEWSIRSFECSMFKPVKYKVEGRVIKEQLESQVCVEVLNNTTNEIFEYRLDVATSSKEIIDSASDYCNEIDSLEHRFGQLPIMSKSVHCSMDRLPKFIA